MSRSFRFHVGVILPVLMLQMAASAADVTLKKLDDRVRVEVRGNLFTDYLFTGYNKPICYPILAPGQVPMTRDFPQKDDTPGESHDHPHHRSLWFTHGSVNGIDFWAEKPGETGSIVTTQTHIEGPTLTTQDEWRAPDGKVILTDTRTLTFSATEDQRVIDIAVELHASHGDITFQDTKEGTMGLRTRPELRLTPVDKKAHSEAHALNSEGLKDKALWGKKADWVDYWAPINGQTYGIAMFDNPQNPRHPTYWHAREYGLVAANPFGVHDFTGQKDEPHLGDFPIKSGQSVTFRYRIIFHKGDPETAKIAEQYKAYAK
ncbi:MAG: hypothetical protein GC162_09255 [Planctomycetes bacterium]|nr:hypothetical protein [Planctomycetota bacterium]